MGRNALPGADSKKHPLYMSRYLFNFVRLALAILLAAPAAASNRGGKAVPGAGASNALPSTAITSLSGISIPSVSAANLPNLGELPGVTGLPGTAIAPKAGEASVLPGQVAPALPQIAIPVVQPEVIGAQAGEQKPGAIGQIEQAAKLASDDRGQGQTKFGGVFDGENPGGMVDAVGVDAALSPASLFDKAYPSSAARRRLEASGALRGHTFDELIVSTLMDNVFGQTKDGERGLDDIPDFPGRADYVQTVNEILDLAERDTPEGKEFAAAAGRIYAAHMLAQAKMIGAQQPLPAPSLPSGEYWDLAAGPNALNHIAGKLEPGVTYVFFDRSAFSTGILEAGRRMLGLDNVKVLQGDLRRLQKPAVGPAAIRWKNVHGYVKGYERRIPELAGWIQPGGRFIVEIDPDAGHRNYMLQTISNQLTALIRDGWTFGFEPLGSGGLETVHFTKPTEAEAKLGAVEQRERVMRSMRRWAEYIEAVEETNRRERAGMDLFQMLRMMGLR